VLVSPAAAANDTVAMGVTSMRHEEAVASSLISSKKFFSICRFMKIIVMTFKIKAAEQVIVARAHNVQFDYLAFSTFADNAVLILLLDHMVIHYSL
jgi:hypothetical protein